MAFLHRIQKSNLKTAYFQFRRCYTHLPHPISTPKTCPMLMPIPHSPFHGMPTNFLNSVRFYAVPVQFQVKPKNEDDDIDGPRLNDQIKAKYVRLVVDDGHSVVSRFEALDRAKKLKLDLVEVDKKANPPVCKIMNYNKEMYKKKESDKERAKSKSEMTMRKECKEVRFSEKTEAKDLKMKSDMVRKLMEKGYRVKVKATGNADQAMLDSISRLSALIEDVCFVESGPHLTKKEAYMIVRHIKYGLGKKGGKKSKDAVHLDAKADEDDAEPLTTNTSDTIEYENQSSPEYQFETQEPVLSNGHTQFSFSPNRPDKSINNGNDPESPPVLDNRYKNPNHRVENKVQSNGQVPPPVLENRYKKPNHRVENKVQSNGQVPPPVVENRYKKVEPRNRFQQPTSNTGPGPVPGTRDANSGTPSNLNQPRHVPVSNTGPGPGIRDANRWTPSNLNQPRQAPVSNTGPGSGTIDANRWTPSNLNQPRQVPTDIGFNPKIDSPPGSRNSMPSRDDINKTPRGPNTTRGPNTKRSGYGLFSRDT